MTSLFVHKPISSKLKVASILAAFSGVIGTAASMLTNVGSIATVGVVGMGTAAGTLVGGVLGSAISGLVVRIIVGPNRADKKAEASVTMAIANIGLLAGAIYGGMSGYQITKNELTAGKAQAAFESVASPMETAPKAPVAKPVAPTPK